mgnify:CR=1 FL=1
MNFLSLSLGLGLLIGMSGVSPAVLAGPEQASAPQAQAETRRYFDGQRWRQVWVSASEIAELSPRPEAAARLRALAPGAETVHQGVQVRLWRIDDATDASPAASTVSRALNTVPATAEGSRFVPVFHLSPRGGAPLVAVGNIILRFPLQGAPQDPVLWGEARGLRLVKALGLAHSYLFHVADGADVLSKAEQLQLGGEVVYALPEWWRKAQRR